MSDLVRVVPHDAGALWQVTFGTGHGNILDLATMRELSGVFVDARGATGLKAICLEGTGADFSFGASVHEHQVEQVQSMLETLRVLVLDLLDSHVATLAAVRGRCLGGGLELVALCHRVFATADATFGQPEIALGVFPPLASIVLPERIGRARAEALCLSGRPVSAIEGHDIGLVDELVQGEPAEAARRWARTELLPHSASSLRFAVRAIRMSLAHRIRLELPEIEKVYLEELMATADANDGIRAFLEKRRPIWKNR
jgi:cyclohexa-1,5-dienecarbonyl-CoA hydratase